MRLLKWEVIICQIPLNSFIIIIISIRICNVVLSNITLELVTDNCVMHQPQQFTTVHIDQPQSSVMYKFEASVCLSDGSFWKPWCTKSVFAHPLYLQRVRVWVTFLYKGHRAKVTQAEKRPLLSCHLTLQQAHEYNCSDGQSIKLTTENSTRHICPAYHMQTFVGGGQQSRRQLVRV